MIVKSHYEYSEVPQPGVEPEPLALSESRALTFKAPYLPRIFF